MPLAAGLGMLAIGVGFTVSEGASLVPLVFVLAGCATLASAVIPKGRWDPAGTLLPAIVVFSCLGVLSVYAASESSGAWVVIPSTAAFICFGFAAFAGWGWIRIHRQGSR
jgi:hypothetical protein